MMTFDPTLSYQILASYPGHVFGGNTWPGYEANQILSAIKVSVTLTFVN